VVARELSRARRAAGGERLPDRAVLLLVLHVQLVDEVVARRPDGRPGEVPPRLFREPLHERRVGGAIDDVVEAVVRAYPLAHDRPPLLAGLSRAELLRDPREPALRLLELGEVVLGHPLRGELGREALELRAHEERLVQLLARDRPDAHAAVRHEVDETEGRETAKRLADGRPADVELLRELLLSEHASGRQLARDDRFLDDEGDVVGLRGVEAHTASVRQTPALSNCASSVEPRSASVDERPPLTACATRSKYPAPTSRW
jgi:hypothetical protein